jgi:transcriptional regulator of acetoin/glycerol metabolism
MNLADNRTHIKSAWHDFIDEGILPSSEVIPKVIQESWVRCKSAEVDPYQRKVSTRIDGDKFLAILEKNKTLVDYSMPYLNNLYQFVRGTGFVLSLASAEGIILKIIGEDNVLKQFIEGNYVEGADWSEKSAGTNGIGTSIFIRSPIQVFSQEHYCICAKNTICSSAPIHDWQYNTIGIVTLTGMDTAVSQHTLGMVVAVANAIENCLTMVKAQDDCRIANEYKSAIMNSISEGIVAVDNNYRVTHINETAQDNLRLANTRPWIGISLFNILPEGNEQLHAAVSCQKLITDREISINTSRGYLKYSITIRPIQSEAEGSIGQIIVIDEFKRTKKLVQRLSGAVALMSFDDLIGENPVFLQSIETAKRAAPSDSVVLLTGESGTGKDLMAQAIHNASHRRKGPFVAINCGAIPKELIGSELFGYSDGAFTGARKGGNIGKFELADGGTIFLDEIGDMPLDMQTNLLRVLEERRIMRIGGNDIIPVNVRVIAATNKPIFEEVSNGRFRQDLFYRLNVISIDIPPLRDRSDDIPLLTQVFYERLVSSFGKQTFPIPDSYIKMMKKYGFPGNIRELQNIIERSVNLSKDGKLEISFLPHEVVSSGDARMVGSGDYSNVIKYASIEDFEKDRILELIDSYEGNISKVAERMNIARSTLYRKMDKYGIVKQFNMQGR